MTWYIKVDSTYSNPIFRCIEFFLGCIIAKMSVSINLRRFQNPVIFFGTMVGLIIASSIAAYLGIAPWHYTLYDWIAIPAFTCLLISQSNDGISIQTKKIQNFIIAISNRTYNFFLVSFFTWPIVNWIQIYFNINNNYFETICAITVNVILTEIAYSLIEAKILKHLLNRYI